MRATIADRAIGILGADRRHPQGTGTVQVRATVADRAIGIPEADS